MTPSRQRARQRARAIAVTKVTARRMSLMVSFFLARQRFAGICLLRAQARPLLGLRSACRDCQPDEQVAVAYESATV